MASYIKIEKGKRYLFNCVDDNLIHEFQLSYESKEYYLLNRYNRIDNKVEGIWISKYNIYDVYATHLTNQRGNYYLAEELPTNFLRECKLKRILKE